MKKAMVFGAGVSGLGAKRLLEKTGYEVIMVDDKKAMTSKEALNNLDGTEIFIKSPGVPYNELVLEAKRKGIKVIDEIELCYQYMLKYKSNAKIIAVTGTNGKTTTTTKITELLQYCGYRAKFAGNIGFSLADILADEIELDYVVLEMSSFQLENVVEFKPFISMVINLTPDHLARYKDEAEYYDTKFNICKNQGKDEYFIYNIDCPEIIKRKEMIPATLVPITKSADKKCDYWVEDGILYSKDGAVLECDKLSLKGQHNLENVLFIVAAAKICGVTNEQLQGFLYHTEPLEHRMEIVLDYGNIRFINDSKATNIDSSKFAIEAYDGCVLICGGFDKGLEWTPLIDLINSHVSEVYFIGDIAEELDGRLEKTEFPKDKIHMLHDVKTTLLDIKERFDKNDKKVILFSPATSSYDQFKNFEERGRVFKELVRDIFGR